jgi:hypothetical protein
MIGLLVSAVAGDLGKKALRVTIEYNIPHRAPTASSNPYESWGVSWRCDLALYICAK